MKTTLETPDAIRRVKSAAAQRGIALREFVTQAVKEKLAADVKVAEKPWVKHMGKLMSARSETEIPLHQPAATPGKGFVRRRRGGLLRVISAFGLYPLASRV